ncbi:MAG: diaminopropionate ammonia-lyase [Gemmatimonadales bacterium]
MRARVNPFVVPGAVPEAPHAAVRAFHRSLPGYQPTPLHRLPAFASAVGLGDLYVKDEGRRFGLLAFKVLGASWALHRLRVRSRAFTTVSAATEGNHGRAVAWSARRLGLEAVIYIRRAAAPFRVRRIEAEGARVVLVDGSYQDAVLRCASDSAANGWQVVSDTGYPGYLEIPHWIAEGYSTLFHEVDEQLRDGGLPPPDLVIVQAGVGGLLHAAVDHWRSRTEPPTLVCVEPVQADPLLESINTPEGDPVPTRGRVDSIMAGLNAGMPSLSAWPVVRRGVELFLAIEDRYAEEAMRRLARPARGDPAVTAGESGAAGVAALLALGEAHELARAREFLRLPGDRRALVIVSEGATDPESYERIVGQVPGAILKS